MWDFKVGNITAAPGEKAQGYLAVPGTPVEMPVTLINGVKEGKTVVITGGTHGGEYAGIETCIRLAKKLTPQEVSGRICIVHPVNTPAFFAKTQYVGPDGKNLNREYPGKADGTVSQRIAYTITGELFAQADFYMDLHGGDIHEALTPMVFYSLNGSSESVKLSLEAAKAMGHKYVCGSVSKNGTFGCAATMGVPGFLAERGGGGVWSDEEADAYMESVENVLRFLSVIEGEAKVYNDIQVRDPSSDISADKTGCWYPCVSLGESVKKGQKTGEIRDFFGNVLSEYRAPRDGVVLYYTTSLAVCGGDPLLSIG